MGFIYENPIVRILFTLLVLIYAIFVDINSRKLKNQSKEKYLDHIFKKVDTLNYIKYVLYTFSMFSTILFVSSIDMSFELKSMVLGFTNLGFLFLFLILILFSNKKIKEFEKNYEKIPVIELTSGLMKEIEKIKNLRVNYIMIAIFFSIFSILFFLQLIPEWLIYRK